MSTMKAIVLEDLNQFSLKEVPIPRPKQGEVLIRMEAAPINPSDIVSLKGQYGLKKQLPFIPGLEGSGTVVESGGGLLGWSLVGKRVACYCDKGNGTWAEYVVTSAKNCVKLTAEISTEQGSCFFANPITAICFMDIIKEQRHQAVIQTAAASAIGKMLLRYCMHENIPIVNIVRREEQVEMLREIGAPYILNSSDENFQQELRKLSVNLNATVAFDCVSGEMTGTLINAMCENSVVYVYGSLSRQNIGGIDPSALIFSNKRVEGLWLQRIMKEKGSISKWNIANRVLNLLPQVLKTDISKEFELGSLNEALEFYKKNMSSGKVLLKPKLIPSNNHVEEEEES